MAGKHASQKTSTTRLPAALRSELGLEDGSTGAAPGPSDARRARAEMFQGQSKGKRGNKALTRKDARRAKRQGVKESRAQHQQGHHRSQPGSRRGESSVRQASNKVMERPAARRIASASEAHREKGKAKQESRHALSYSSMQAKHQQKKHVEEATRTPLQQMLDRHRSDARDESVESDGTDTARQSAAASSKRKRPASSIAMTSAEQNEEDEIAWLEAHLGPSKSAKKSKANGRDQRQSREMDEQVEEDDFGQDNDGLDDLLDDLDVYYPGMYEAGADDDELDSAMDSGEDQASDLEEDWSDSMIEEDLEGSFTSSSTDGVDHELERDLEESESGSNSAPTSETKPSDELRHESSGSEEPTNIQSAVSAVGTTARYVPPALRAKLAGSESLSAEEQKLRRQAKGLLNRLGEGNVDSILGEIEKLFREYSRASATQQLTQLIIDTIKASDNVADSFVILYATIAASLHRVIGVEFGAHYIQVLTERFTTALDAARKDSALEEDTTKKAARNLVALLAASYSVGIVACPLIYDIIKIIIDVNNEQDTKQASAMTEIDVDLLLRIVKICGSQLRQDDTSSLKAIANLAQTKLDKSSSTRTRFMLDSLQDLSNSRARAIAPNAGQEQLAKMRKYLGGLAKRRTIRTSEALRVGLRDLRDADKRGKWWLVGAAWAGYNFNGETLDKDSKDPPRSFAAQQRKELASSTEDPRSEALVALAKKHGMNTVLRQQIFVVLLSSQDYLDAVQRLLSLTHRKPSQRKEIVRVLLYCIGLEPVFNPYYVVVVSRLAHEDGVGTRITMQYCLWDFMRQLGEVSVGGRSILARHDDFDAESVADEIDFGDARVEDDDVRTISIARAFGWWMAKHVIGLEVLRPIDFTALKRRGRKFLQLLFVFVLLGAQASSPAQMLALPAVKKKASIYPITGAREDDEHSAIALPQADASTIEAIFVQGTRSHQRIAQGLVVFFEQHLRPRDCLRLARGSLGISEATAQRLLAARSSAIETVRVGSQVAAHDVDEFDDDA